MRVVRGVLVSLAAAGMAAALPAQSSFEGTIYFTGMNPDKPVPDTMIQTTKGTMVRVEITSAKKGRGGAVIYDTKTRTMTMIMNDQKKYITMPMPAPPAASEKAMSTVKVSKTGRTETVAGVTCEVYTSTWTDAGGVTKEGGGCLAKGVGLAMPDPGGSSDARMKLYHEFAKQDLHMVKAWNMKDGQPKIMLVAVRIDRGSVDPALFKAPAGYTEMHVPTQPKPTTP